MKQFLALTLILIASWCLTACRSESAQATKSAKEAADKTVDGQTIDEALLQAARAGLGERDGSVVVLDARDGRVRAVVNPESAWQHDYPIGSAIKPFVAAAMLNDGTLDPDKSFRCPRRIKIGQMSIHCAHPHQSEPITLARALAISCNIYFAYTSRRLNVNSLHDELQRRGLGRTTGLDAPNERAGKLAPVGETPEARAAIAIGETDSITVTPLGLATAFLSLITNSPPLTPHIGKLTIPTAAATTDNSDRTVLLAGLRGCTEYGTGADESGWKDLPFTVIGKTGSPTIPGDARTHGWFVGAATTGSGETASATELVVVVFLAHGYGHEAAMIAHRVFETYARTWQPTGKKPEQKASAEPQLLVSLFDPLRPTDLTLWSNAALTLRDEATGRLLLRIGAGSRQLRLRVLYLPGGRLRASGVNPDIELTKITIDADDDAPIEARVGGTLSRQFGPHLVVRASEERRALIPLERLSLEDYVAGVVSVEGSQEDELEALRALAIAVRSYAAVSLEAVVGKHSSEGFTLCSSTHCQRYVGRTARNLALRATEETRGQVLAVGDRPPHILRALFHACCGGHTSDARELWPSDPDQAGTAGASDPACAAPDHRAWTRTFKTRDLFSALEREHNLGQETETASIRSISIEQENMSAVRATRIRIEDDHGRSSEIPSANFTVAIGRALGWNACPSPPATIRREGDQIIMTGRGFGHGAGLCQHGAHSMAMEGKSARDILTHFFAGAQILRIADCGLRIEEKGISPVKSGNLQPAIHNPQSTILQSAIHNPQSFNPQSTIRNPQSAILQSAIRNPQSAILQPAIRNPQFNDGNTIIDYAAPNTREDAQEVAQLIAQARAELDSVVSFKETEPLRLRIYATTADFIAAAGVSGEMAGTSKDGLIHLQPVQLLRRRGSLRATVRHEYAHYVITLVGGPKVARWFQEGMAVYFAGEGDSLERYRARDMEPSTLRELECALLRARSIKERRALYAAAYAQVARLIVQNGESKIWQDLRDGRYNRDQESGIRGQCF